MPDTIGDLQSILCEVFMRGDIVIGPQTTAADVVGWDSFKHVEIILLVEERYGIEMPVKEVNAAHTVGELVGLIDRKRAEKAGAAAGAAR